MSLPVLIRTILLLSAVFAASLHTAAKRIAYQNLELNNKTSIPIILPDNTLSFDVDFAIPHKSATPFSNSTQISLQFQDSCQRDIYILTLLRNNDFISHDFSPEESLQLSLDSITPTGNSINIIKRQFNLSRDNSSKITAYNISLSPLSKVSLYCGDNEPAYLTSFPLPTSNIKRLLISSPRKVSLSYLILNYTEDPRAALSSSLSATSVQDLITSELPDPQGVWHFLDRATDPHIAQIGGSYRLLLIPATGCNIPSPYTYATEPIYDLIYIDGATANAPLWSSGIIKARLYATAIPNQFAVAWFASDFTPLQGENYAILSPNHSLLTFNFPSYSAQIRFTHISTL